MAECATGHLYPTSGQAGYDLPELLHQMDMSHHRSDSVFCISLLLQYQHAETPRIPEPGGTEGPAAGSAALWELRLHNGLSIVSVTAAGRLYRLTEHSILQTLSLEPHCFCSIIKGKSRLLLSSCWSVPTDGAERSSASNNSAASHLSLPVILFIKLVSGDLYK